LRPFRSSLGRLCGISAVVLFSGCAAKNVRTAATARRELVERASERPELAVLFVGNSYSFGVPKAFSKLAAERGRNVRVGQVTHNGWTLARHASNQETLRKIRESRWDVIVLQEQSRIPSYPARRELLMFPAVRRLAGESRTHGAIPVLYQTWGRRGGDSGRTREDFPAMTASIRTGYLKAAESAGGLVLVPVGDAWQREVYAGRGDRLYMPDGSHPSPNGNALAAEVFFEVIFGD